MIFSIPTAIIANFETNELKVSCDLCDDEVISGNRAQHLAGHLIKKEHKKRLTNPLGVTAKQFEYDIAEWFLTCKYKL